MKTIGIALFVFALVSCGRDPLMIGSLGDMLPPAHLGKGGVLTIQPDNIRPSTILVAGTGVWQNLYQVKATAEREDILIDRMCVIAGGDSASFEAVAVAFHDAQGHYVLLGQSILPAGQDRAKDIDLSANPVLVPDGGSAEIQLWAKLAAVLPSSATGGAWDGVPRSGKVVSLGLAEDSDGAGWDARYNGMLNVRATGVTTGQRIYAAVPTVGPTQGNDFIIRKSKPTIAKLALMNTALQSGADQELYKWMISADPAGSVGIKQSSFVVVAQTSSSSFKLCNFRVRRGSTDLTPSQVTIKTSPMTPLKEADLSTECLDGSPIANNLSQITCEFSLTFANEEAISGSGNVYTLHAMVQGGLSSGDSVDTFFLRVGGSGPLPATGWTGWLTTSGYVTDGAVTFDGAISWSDMSEVPHSDVAGGSKDWMWDNLIENLTHGQVLTR